ncbi:transcriptional regulator [Rouxiella silvae]|uniref:Transcriptional regulator n=1 Tax=Rouxiella silvae TaxID=1646373 RepID=A0ABX3U2F5_9GAMM|nr:DUF1315 family protein [Rouxiella silvae]ORJ21692.1 transcriptional regulator [Rouxiella silvae]
MEIHELVDVMTPEIYQRLALAVELGKWPDGVRLTELQKEHSLQVVMLYQARHNVDAQHMTVGPNGQIVTKSKQELKQQFQDVIRLKPQ